MDDRKEERNIFSKEIRQKYVHKGHIQPFDPFTWDTQGDYLEWKIDPGLGYFSASEFICNLEQMPLIPQQITFVPDNSTHEEKGAMKLENWLNILCFISVSIVR